jgi:3-dehydroquinate synthase
LQRIDISGLTGSSTVLVGETIARLVDYAPADRTIVITDHKVEALYGRRFPPSPTIVIGSGEAAKNLDTVRHIYQRLLALEADRSSFVVAVGGGVVCDTVGFAASTFLRGIGCGFVASTLLAQVDASVGGKNGVNLDGYKNMVGVFNQPRFVICDLELLDTLPPEEVRCGLAEIVKHAAIADAALFRFLENHSAEVLALEPAVMERLVADSVRTKAAIVNRDEREAGERRKLNFGHTVGHALEKSGGLRHGEAVSRGMVAAAALSVKMGLLERGAADRLTALLQRLELPTGVWHAPQNILEALKHDKKREGDQLHFVLLESIGRAVIERVPIRAVEQFFTSR